MEEGGEDVGGGGVRERGAIRSGRGGMLRGLLFFYTGMLGKFLPRRQALMFFRSMPFVFFGFGLWVGRRSCGKENVLEDGGGHGYGFGTGDRVDDGVCKDDYGGDIWGYLMVMLKICILMMSVDARGRKRNYEVKLFDKREK